MGVGYPLDILVSVALGVDMFDCVFPTRTARFGVGLCYGTDVRIKVLPLFCFVLLTLFSFDVFYSLYVFHF